MRFAQSLILSENYCLTVFQGVEHLLQLVDDVLKKKRVPCIMEPSWIISQIAIRLSGTIRRIFLLLSGRICNIRADRCTLRLLPCN